jgi:hypothetical protein
MRDHVSDNNFQILPILPEHIANSPICRCRHDFLRERPMQDDPILAEMRKTRQEYSASLNHDPARIYEDILRRQQNTGRKLVRLRPRKPPIGSNATN